MASKKKKTGGVVRQKAVEIDLSPLLINGFQNDPKHFYSSLGEQVSSILNDGGKVLIHLPNYECTSIDNRMGWPPPHIYTGWTGNDAVEEPGVSITRTVAIRIPIEIPDAKRVSYAAKTDSSGKVAKVGLALADKIVNQTLGEYSFDGYFISNAKMIAKGIGDISDPNCKNVSVHIKAKIFEFSDGYRMQETPAVRLALKNGKLYTTSGSIIEAINQEEVFESLGISG